MKSYYGSGRQVATTADDAVLPGLQDGVAKQFPIGVLGITRQAVPLVAAIGSSTIARGENNIANAYQRTWGGVMNVANILSQGRFYCPQNYSMATSGQTTQHMVDVQLPAVLALNPRPKGCYFQPGSNDIRSGVPFATTQGNIATVLSGFKEAGIVPIIGVPQATLGDTATVQAGFAQMARYLRDLSAATPGAILVDPFTAFMNPALATYESLPAFMDTVAPRIHLNHTGTQIYAQAIVKALADAGWAPCFDVPLRSNGDLFSANNRSGNLTANGMMSGTGGTITAPATGTLGAGWQFTPNSVGGTIALSQQADGTGCVMTFSGTATQGTGLVLYRDFSGAELANMAVNDTLETIVEAAWGALTNVSYIGAQIRLTMAGVQTDDLDGGPSSQGGPLLATPSAIFRPVPRLVTSAVTAARLRLWVYPEASAAWSGAVTFKSAVTRRRFV